MIVEHTPINCRILNATPAEMKVVSEICSYRRAGYDKTTAFQSGRWDGVTRLCRFQGGGWVFPAGLLPLVQKRVKCQVSDLFVTDPDISRVGLDGVELWDFQQEAVDIALSKRRGLVWSATATGKTVIAAAVIAAVNGRTLWLTDRGALAAQVARELRELTGKTVSVYQGKWKEPQAQIVVAMVQSLSRHRKEAYSWLQGVKLLIADEVHQAGAKTWLNIAMSCPAQRRIGLSGTALERSDGANLLIVSAFGPTIFRRKATDEDVKEHLAPLRAEIYRVHTTRPSGFRDFFVAAKARLRNVERAKSEAARKEWQECYLANICLSAQRNLIVVKETLRGVKLDQPTLVFVSRISHGESLLTKFRERLSYDCVDFISKKTPVPRRDELFEKLRRGPAKVLICTDKVGGAGIDIPNVERIVLAGGLQAPILVKQITGRGMRDKAGKPCVIIDFLDAGSPMLTKHSRQRIKHHADQGAVIVHKDPDKVRRTGEAQRSE